MINPNTKKEEERKDALVMEREEHKAELSFGDLDDNS